MTYLLTLFLAAFTSILPVAAVDGYGVPGGDVEVELAEYIIQKTGDDDTEVTCEFERVVVPVDSQKPATCKIKTSKGVFVATLNLTGDDKQGVRITEVTLQKGNHANRNAR